MNDAQIATASSAFIVLFDVIVALLALSVFAAEYFIVKRLLTRHDILKMPANRNNRGGESF